MEDRGLRKKEDDDDDDDDDEISQPSPANNKNNSTPTSTTTSTPAPRRSSTGGKSSASFKDKNKQPLCICPECDKKLTSMRGLFGHYGVKHRTTVNHDEITYACPFCVVDLNDEEAEFEVFEDTEDLVSCSVFYILCVLISCVIIEWMVD